MRARSPRDGDHRLTSSGRVKKYSYNTKAIIASEKYCVGLVGEQRFKCAMNPDLCQHSGVWLRQRCPQYRIFLHSQLMPRFRKVLDREGVAQERTGNRDGNSPGDPGVLPSHHNLYHQRNAPKLKVSSDQARWSQETKGRSPPSASQPAPGYS
jgi:hypothetical protein